MSNCREEMRLKSHQRVNTQIKQEAEGKHTAVSLPARFSLLPLELACGGVGNHRLRRSTSPPRAPQSGEPACAEGHDVLEMEAVFFNTFPCFESSPARAGFRGNPRGQHKSAAFVKWPLGLPDLPQLQNMQSPIL